MSRYQGKITLDGWRKVKAAGYKGAMLKTVSTNRKLSKRADGLYIDPTFETNYRNARAAGLDVGVYYYTYATSEAMADAELALLRQAVRGKELTMPVAVDMEDETLAVLKPNDLTNLAAYHLEQIEKMGLFAQLYTYTSYANRFLEMERLAGRWDVWLADYTGKTPNVTFIDYLRRFPLYTRTRTQSDRGLTFPPQSRRASSVPQASQMYTPFAWRLNAPWGSLSGILSPQRGQRGQPCS